MERAPQAGPAAALSSFAVTAPGLEAIAAAELRGLGIEGVPEPGGVAWTGSLEQVYLANLHLRTASRVLVRVAEFQARAFYELERRAARLPWDRFIGKGRPVQWRVSCRKSRLYHQGAVAQRFQEAVERAAGATGGERVESEEEDTDGGQLFVVRFVHDQCTVSVDTSGALLHRRGYRQATAKAPLRETLAAAMLLGVGWDGQEPLLDPMCGAGTIAIEGALIARRIPPGIAGPDGEPRRFAFQEWPDFDAASWSGLLERARAGVLATASVPIQASDRDEGAIAAAESNAARAGVAADLSLAVRPLSAIAPPAGVGSLVTNPPYGLRVGEVNRLRDLYAALGRVAREKLPAWQVALLSADRRLEGHTGLPFQDRLSTRNGGIPVRVVVARVPA